MKRLPLLLALALGSPALFAADAWLFQLQNPEPEKIAASGFKHCIIDYSRDGSADGSFTPTEIAELRSAGVETLCYFSIGEAEDYRYYWQKTWRNPKTRPSWLGRENPDWKGNFTVRYWDPRWREEILLPYLEKIVATGYDGVYLDIVDGFEYWGDPDTYDRNRETRLPTDPVDEADAATRMIDLVTWIAEQGRKLAGPGRQFLVFPQQGERLIDYDTDGRYLAATNGFGVESLWYNGLSARPESEMQPRLEDLRTVRDAGKRVIVTEYIDDGSGLAGKNAARIEDFLARAGKENFYPYVARKNQALDTINAIPGVQP